MAGSGKNRMLDCVWSKLVFLLFDVLCRFLSNSKRLSSFSQGEFLTKLNGP